MREIRFRGKRVDNGEWVYGNYLEKIDPTSPTDVFWAAFIHDKALTLHKIDPDTLGQFSGFTDSKGVMVYEGDIAEAWVAAPWDWEVPILVRGEITFGDPFEGCFCFKSETDDTCELYSIIQEDIKVINNIHETANV